MVQIEVIPVLTFSSAEYIKGEETTTDGMLLVSNWSDNLISEISYQPKSRTLAKHRQ